VQFTSAARDPDGDQLLTVWDFGDGTKGGGPSISHTYRAAGTYTATLTVSDLGGKTATASIEIRVSGPAPRTAAPDAGGVAGESAESAARLTAPKSQRLRSGLRLRVACPVRCDARAVLRYAGERIGTSRAVRIRDDRRHTLRVRLSRKAQRALRAALRRAGTRSLKVTVVLRVRTAGGASTIRRPVRLRR
jgi:hypothetical protein